MKKIHSALTFCTLTLILILVSSCEKAYLVPEEQSIENVSYSNDMQPFFDAKCVSCHNGTGVPLNLTSPGSYDALFAGDYIDINTPSESELYKKILPGESMAEHATPSDREMTLIWIEEGAKNNK